MKIRKIIRRVGDSTGVIFNKDEQRIYNLKKDAVVEISIKVIRGGRD